jgi:hypothetical protein
MDFIIFGFMDNFLLILGMYYSYASIERWLKKYWFDTDNVKMKLALASVSAGLGNTFSDAMGFLVTGNFKWTILTIIGCLLGMLVIPLIEKFRRHNG